MGYEAAAIRSARCIKALREKADGNEERKISPALRRGRGNLVRYEAAAIRSARCTRRGRNLSRFPDILPQLRQYLQHIPYRHRALPEYGKETWKGNRDQSEHRQPDWY